MAAHPQSLPADGTLTDHSLPRILLGAWHDAFSGLLELTRERTTKRVYLNEGIPVHVESNLARERLGRLLVDSERITADDLENVSAIMEQKKVREGAALLELKLLEPKELVLALRDQVRRRVVDSFGWADGRFSFSEAAEQDEHAQAFRVDPLTLVQRGLATHWDAERLLADLGPHLARHAVPNERFEALAGRLDADAETEALLADLDPERAFGEAVYRSPSVGRLATAWVLAESGGLDFRDGPPGRAETPTDEETREPEVAFQFDFGGAPAEDAAAGDSVDAQADPTLSPEAEQLRKEILDKHERLDEITHYEVLGVEPNAADGAIKKAYFGLAKRAHPDSLARVGLSDLHREANEVFARIAQAYQTLSNPAKRKEYDAKQTGQTPSTDANRLAQAETLFRKAEILIKLGNFGDALEFLRPCVELWAEEPDYQGALGWALYKNKPSDTDGAREHLERAQTAKPDDPLLCFRLGVVLRKLGETDRAQELLDRAKTLEKG